MGVDLTVYKHLHSVVSKEVATVIILYNFFEWPSDDTGTHGAKQCQTKDKQ